MYRQTGDFLRDWAYESESTLKLLRNINQEHFSHKSHENVRDIATLTRHMVHSVGEMLNRTGLEVYMPDEQELETYSPEQVADAYERVADSAANEVQTKWNDGTLEHKVNLYGEEWANGYTLLVLLLHQAHHRGQLTVLMRQAGLPLSGVYGPTKEEWESMGLPPMK